jgi:hypothetical protein
LSIDTYLSRLCIFVLELASHRIVDPVLARVSATGWAIEREEVVDGEHGGFSEKVDQEDLCK